MIITNDLNDTNYQITNQMNGENNNANINSNNNGNNNIDEIHLQQEPQYEIIICTNNDLKRKFTNEENLCENLNQNFHIEYQCHQISNECCKESDNNFEKCNNHYVNTISENNYNHTHIANPQQPHSQIHTNFNEEMHQDQQMLQQQQPQQELSYINLTVMHHPHLDPENHHQNHIEKSIQTSIYSLNDYPNTCASSSPLFTIAPSHSTTWTQSGQIHQSAVNSSSVNNHNSRDTSSQINNKNHKSNCQSDMVEDTEDKNLSWLFNFKLDDIANLSPEIKRKRTTTTTNSNTSHNSSSQQNENHHQTHHNNYQQQLEEITQQQQQHIQKDLNCIDDDELNVAENVVISNTPTVGSTSGSSNHLPKKPPFTYTELIEYALEDKGELTVSGIYQWISDRFSYYKSNDDRWKNSVRHNLSINPHFRKGSKAPQGAGHLWTISSRDSEANFLAWEHKKQRLELFFKMEAANNNKTKNINKNVSISEVRVESPYQEELNAATASIMLPDATNGLITTISDPDSPSDSGNIYSSYHDILPLSHQQSDELRRSAGDILNGVRRNVEVQIMQPNELQSYSILSAEDYLNPISKEEIVQESGLGYRRHETPTSEFYVTTIDPIELGINMSSNGDTDEILFHDDFNYFGGNIIA